MGARPRSSARARCRAAPGRRASAGTEASSRAHPRSLACAWPAATAPSSRCSTGTCAEPSASIWRPSIPSRAARKRFSSSTSGRVQQLVRGEPLLDLERGPGTGPARPAPHVGHRASARPGSAPRPCRSAAAGARPTRGRSARGRRRSAAARRRPRRSRVAAERRGMPDAREGLEERGARGGQAGVAPLPERRVGRSASSSGRWPRMPVDRGDGELRRSARRRGRAARRWARAGPARASSRTRASGSARLPETRSPADRERVGARARPRAARACRSCVVERGAERRQLGGRLARRVRVNAGRQLERAGVRLGASRARPGRAERRQQLSIGGRATSPRVEQHHLLLDPDRVGGPRSCRPPSPPSRAARCRASGRLRRALGALRRRRRRGPRTAPAARRPLDEASACHWTPNSEAARLGTRSPPTTPSGAQPTARRPSPSSSIALVVEGVDARGARRPSAAPGGCRRSSSTAWVAWRAGAVLAVLDLAAETSGRCWCSVPPRATLSTCMPAADRQDRHRRGASARRASASSKRSSSGSVGPSSGCGSAP